MENLRNFVILQFDDGLEIVNKNWRINNNSFFYPMGVKNRNDYFKLLNTMVRPGYHNEKYDWLPLYVNKIYGSEDAFGKAMGKLAWFKYYNSIGETNARNPYNGYTSKYNPSLKELKSPNVENKKNCSEPTSKLLPDDLLEQKSPTDPIPFNNSTTNGTKQLSATNITKNRPTTSTRNSTATINYCPKKYNDDPVSKLSKCITPSSGSTNLNPFTVKIPLQNTVIVENLSRGIINKNKLSTSTQSATTPKNNLIPQLGVSVSPSNVSDQTKIIYQKIIDIEKVITGINSRVTRSLINQDKIISLIEKQNRNSLAEKSVDKMTSEFENHFTLKFPLKTLDGVFELEKLLFEKQYYKLLKTKLLSYSGADLKSVIINILTKLFTWNVAAKITFTTTSYIKRPTLEVIDKFNLQNRKIYKLIIDVVMQTLKCDEEQIKTTIRIWLRHAKEKYDEAEQVKN